MNGASARAFPSPDDFRRLLAAPVADDDDNHRMDPSDAIIEQMQKNEPRLHPTSLVDLRFRKDITDDAVNRLQREEFRLQPTSLVDLRHRKDTTDDLVEQLQKEVVHWKNMYFMALKELDRPLSSSSSPGDHHPRKRPHRPCDDNCPPSTDRHHRSSSSRSSLLTYQVSKHLPDRLMRRRPDDDDDDRQDSITVSKRENSRYQVMQSPGGYRFAVHISASTAAFVSNAVTLGRGHDEVGALFKFPALSGLEALTYAAGVPVVVADRAFVWDHHRHRVQLQIEAQLRRTMTNQQTSPIVLQSLSPTNQSLLNQRRSLKGSIFVYESYRSDLSGQRRVVTSFGVRQDHTQLVLVFVKLVVRI